MLKTWLNKRICSTCLILGCLSLTLVLTACAAPEPEVCALCGGEPRDVPCLLDSSTGDIGKLAGTLAPGKFQFVGCSEVMGPWDSDAKLGQVTVPDATAETDEALFCQSCRDALTDKGTYVILDLSDPAVSVVYPLEDGAAYDILGWTVTVAEGPEEYSLTIRPNAW